MSDRVRGRLCSIPPDRPFLDVLAAYCLREAGPDPLALPRVTVLLPTRRAARALSEAFLRQGGGRALLLPRIATLGGVDEASLPGVVPPPPALDEHERLAVLCRLVLARGAADGAPLTLDRAWPLAAELARLLDEAQRSEVDLAERLPLAADAAFAGHWQQTVEFLGIVTRLWPAILSEAGLLDPAARQVALLRAQADAWRERGPEGPVIVAGTTGAIPSVAALLGRVLALPQGLVVLPGLDRALSEDDWAALEDGHPQAGMRHLLMQLGVRREEVEEWDGTEADPAPVEDPRVGAPPPGRVGLLRAALLPASGLTAWRDAPPPGADALRGLRRLRPADQQEEAVAIALLLRDALERPGLRAALVTPDRDLAVRVAAELLRFGVVSDDSAGEPLDQTPPAAFLRLLAAAVAERLAPVALLSLLKHPLCAAGLPTAACRVAARALERACLRGPRPGPDAAGLRDAIEAEAAAGRLPAAGPAAANGDRSGSGASAARARDLLAFLERVEGRLEPLLALFAGGDAAPAAMLSALLAAAEAMAATDEQPGADRLWAGEDGAALATHLSRLSAALAAPLASLPPQPPATLPGLLDESMAGQVVRSRRALRGRGAADGLTEHPRVFIWGLLESRLQSADLMVLGGLAEGTWPAACDPGPWMSRAMRARIGLPSPEEEVGQNAHDFVATCCAAPEVVLCCPDRRDGAPTVPARWLVRLDALLRGARPADAPQDAAHAPAALPEHPAAVWARALDLPADGPHPVAPPAPRPPVALRPRRLSVTEVETWLRDPYAIYARHVLRLRALDPIEQNAEAADYGNVVHEGLRRFLDRVGTAWPANAEALLLSDVEAALAEARLRPAVVAWWRPRLRRIAAWAAEVERDRRVAGGLVLVRPEVGGEAEIGGPAGPFRLRGRADRIERRRDGALAILDYKTGAVPSEPEVREGWAPQLPLQAAMAARGAYGADLAGRAAELTYWHLTGGAVPGREMRLFRREEDGGEAVAEAAWAALCARIARFDDPATPYLSQPHPGEVPRFSDYALLARVGEWAAAEEE